jgi:hypothetical protein
LASLGVPFIVTSGGGTWASLPPVLGRAPHLDKPYDADELEMAMRAAFLPRTGGGRAGL